MAIVRRQGQLQEATSEELSSLAQESGLPVPPTTPSGAAGVGASEDAAKMAGTKAQKTAALQQAVTPSKTLREAERREAPREEKTEQERAAEKRSQQLATLGSLNSRVDQIIENRFKAQAPAEGAVPQAPTVQAETLNDLNPAEQEIATALLNQIAASDDPKEQLDLMEQLRSKVPGLKSDPNQINRYFGELGLVVGKDIATTIQDAITVQDLDPAELGFADLVEMADVLGVDPSALEGMTFAQLQDQVAAVQQEEFARIDTLQRELQDPATGPARREQIQRELAALSQVGATGVEAAVADVAAAVEAADVLEFGGQEKTLEELLNDDHITDMVERFIEDPNSEFARKLAEEEPAFVEWINANKTAMEQAVKGLELTAGRAQIKDEFFGNLKELGDLELDDKFVDALFPAGDWDPAEMEQMMQSDFYQLLSDPTVDKAQREGLASFLTKASDVDPAIVKDFVAMSKEDLTSRSTRALDSYLKYREQHEAFQAIDPGDVDAMMDFVFGKDVDPADIREMKLRAIASKDRSTLGRLERAFGKDLSDPKSVYTKIQARLKSGEDPQGFADWVNKVKAGSVGLDPKVATSNASMSKNPIFAASKKYLGDGQLDKNELFKLVDGGKLPSLSVIKDSKSAAKASSLLKFPLSDDAFTMIKKSLTQYSTKLLEKAQKKYPGSVRGAIETYSKTSKPAFRKANKDRRAAYHKAYNDIKRYIIDLKKNQRSTGAGDVGVWKVELAKAGKALRNLKKDMDRG